MPYRLSHHASDEAEGLRAALERLPGVTRAIIAGDVRRRAEVVKDVIIVLIAESSPGDLFRRLNQLPGVNTEFAGQDERRLTLRFPGGSTAQVVATTPVNAGAVLVQATGSEGISGSWPLTPRATDLP